MNEEKKVYEAPAVEDYGAVRELTRQFELENSDVPGGAPGTAYPPGT